jgi:hypothetical protein
MELANHLLASREFFMGALVMGILMFVLMVYAGYLRAQNLYLSYRAGTPVKLGDEFYYLVPEGQYNRLMTLKNQHVQELRKRRI